MARARCTKRHFVVIKLGEDKKEYSCQYNFPINQLKGFLFLRSVLVVCDRSY